MAMLLESSFSWELFAGSTRQRLCAPAIALRCSLGTEPGQTGKSLFLLLLGALFPLEQESVQGAAGGGAGFAVWKMFC